MSESAIDEPVFAEDVFRVKAEEIGNTAVGKSAMQAVDSFRRFTGGAPVGFPDLDEALVSEWVAWLFSRGYTLSSVTVYVSRLSALYGKAVKESLAHDNGCFAAVRGKLREAARSGAELNADPDTLRKLRGLVQRDCSGNAAAQLAKDILLFSLYNGGLSLEEIGKARKPDHDVPGEAVAEIVERYSRPKNKYLFPLRQSELTPNQLGRSVAALYRDALRMAGISAGSFSDTTPADLWATLAMRCGVSLSDIAACVAGRPVNPIYLFAAAGALSDEEKEGVRQRVTKILTRDAEEWYAMQFRPRVKYDMVKARMEAAGLRFSSSYYPMEEIYKRVGKKMVHTTRPIVPGLLFFKSRATELPGLFYHIGDLAWGYRQSRNVRSPYAVISAEAIAVYQSTIGKFSPDTEVFPVGTVELKEGDRVEIIGGDFMGRRATFEREVRPKEKAGGEETPKRVIYRLRMIGDNDIEWVVNVDPRLIKKTD